MEWTRYGECTNTVRLGNRRHTAHRLEPCGCVGLTGVLRANALVRCHGARHEFARCRVADLELGRVNRGVDPCNE